MSAPTGDDPATLPPEVPVVVVGGGPVGIVAAALLGRADVTALVLEREREPYHLPRAVHLDDEVLRILQSLGVAEQVLACTRPMPAMEVVDARRRTLLTFPRRLQTANGYPAANMVHQPVLEAILRAAAERHGVRVRAGWEVEGLEPAGDRVRVQARRRDTGTAATVTARYVLACDGARSGTREALGIRSRGRSFRQRWLVLDTRIDSGLPEFPHAQQVCDPRRPATFVPVTGDRYRWEFQLLPGERAEDLTRPAVLARLLAPWIPLERARVERAATYTFQATAAERWRAGRVFLLGDAAHLMPPFLGQGLCAGLRDAQNLAWKLGLVLAGGAGSTVLDTYEQERAPHVAEITRFAARIGAVMQGGGRGGEGLRWLASRTVVELPGVRRRMEHRQVPGLRPGPLVPAAARGRRVGGSLLPQPVVLTGDGTPVRLDEVLGDGFALLGFGGDPLAELSATAQARWLGLGVHPVLVAPPLPRAVVADPRVTVVRDVTGALGDWAAERRAGYLLVRPDRYVFGVAEPGGTGAGLERLAALLERGLHLRGTDAHRPAPAGPGAAAGPRPPAPGRYSASR